MRLAAPRATLPRRPRDDEGAIAIVMAVCALVVFGLAAMVVDLGHARDVRRQAQAAADASALAGGNRLYLTSQTAAMNEAAAEVKAYAAANYGTTDAEWTACTDPARPAGFVASGASPCISFDHATAPTEVRVMMPVRLVRMPLASVLGINQARVDAAAQAKLDTGGAAPCGLCVIGSGNHVLQNGDVLVSGASVHFNGNVSLGPQGQVQVTGGGTTVQGTVSGASGFTPPAQTGRPPIDDPLAFLTLPPSMTGLTYTAGVSPCVKGPGLYSGFNFPNGTCTLAPGLYVISGGSTTRWMVTGGTSIVGNGVTLYFTCGTPAVPTPCASGQGGAWLDAAGNGHVGITAPTTGPLQGLAIAYDRKNDRDLNLSGNGLLGLTGSVYAKAGHLRMDGNACTHHMNSLVVVEDLEFNSNNACLNATYSPGLNVEIPPSGLRLTR